MTTTLALATGVIATACGASSETQPRPDTSPISENPGPTQPCTQIGCSDGLHVTLESTSDWPDGDYRFEIEAGDERVTCQASLPVPPCPDSMATPVRSVSCDPVGIVEVVESGCALPRASQDASGVAQAVSFPQAHGPDTPTSTPLPPPLAPPVTHAFPSILFDAKLRPRRVEIAVSWNGRLVGRTEFAPVFERLQPNGPGCPPICHFATATLVLSF